MAEDAVRTRTRNAAATSEAILAAARCRFQRESYENVGLRDIAGDVGVDVALISRYFGNKEQLFRRVCGKDKPPVIAGATPDQLAEFFASILMEASDDDHQAHMEKLMIVMRSASSPQAAPIVCDAFYEDGMAPIANLLSGCHTEIRAGMAMAILLGTGMLRTIMSVEPLCEGDGEVLRRKLVKLFKVALSEDEQIV